MKPLLPIFIAALFAASCQGPAAEDVALCRDTIQRLCAQPVCDEVTTTLAVPPTADCQATLQARTGCGADDFAFGAANAPTRERFLDCRVPLMRNGNTVGTPPACDDVFEAFDRCPDFASFFGGRPE